MKYASTLGTRNLIAWKLPNSCSIVVLAINVTHPGESGKFKLVMMTVCGPLAWSAVHAARASASVVIAKSHRSSASNWLGVMTEAMTFKIQN